MESSPQISYEDALLRLHYSHLQAQLAVMTVQAESGGFEGHTLPIITNLDPTSHFVDVARMLVQDHPVIYQGARFKEQATGLMLSRIVLDYPTITAANGDQWFLTLTTRRNPSKTPANLNDRQLLPGGSSFASVELARFGMPDVAAIFQSCQNEPSAERFIARTLHSIATSSLPQSRKEELILWMNQELATVFADSPQITNNIGEKVLEMAGGPSHQGGGTYGDGHLHTSRETWGTMTYYDRAAARLDGD